MKTNEPKNTNQENEAMEPRPKKHRLRGALISGGAGILVIGAGFGAGLFIKEQQRKKAEAEVVEIDISQLIVDEKEVYEKYKASSSYEKDLTPAEAWNASLYLFSKSESSFSYSVGAGVAMGLVTQNINSCSIHHNGAWFEESLSKSSMVETAWRYYEASDKSATSYSGSGVNPEATTAKWNEGSKQVYADEASFKSVIGFALSTHRSNYNITNYSILDSDAESGSGDGGSKITKTGEGYTIDIEINTKIACEDYRTQMVHTSNLYNKPRFYFSHVTLKTDEKLNPISMRAHEKYHAATSAIISSDVENDITTYYFLDANVAIPALKENVTYANPK
jgi:hypothetical protein